jgi:heme-degrading monooxygenase HmoA
MIVKVLIKRHAKKDCEREFFELLKQIRANATNQEGYISGETLVSTDDPQEFIVISTWQSLEDWVAWRDSKKRKDIDGKIKAYQLKPTTYESYVFRKYRISVQKSFPKAEGR